MRGVVMSVKGRYAVLLTKNGEFAKVRNRNYTVGETVSVTNNTSRICAVAASLLVVCGGIGSYFTPAGYVSVDINPSLLLTLNVYNKVIDVEALNDDAVVLLEEAHIKGMNVEKSVDALIETSKQVGYINENNKDVIVEVVSGIRAIEITNNTDAEMVVERAEKADLCSAKEMGVSIAKAKALADYTVKKGGTVSDNAQRLVNKSVKEIRKVLESADTALTSDISPTKAPEEVKPERNTDNKKRPVWSFTESVHEEEQEVISVSAVPKPTGESLKTPAPMFDIENEEQSKTDNKADEKAEIIAPVFTPEFAPPFEQLPSTKDESVNNDKTDKEENKNWFEQNKEPVLNEESVTDNKIEDKAENKPVIDKIEDNPKYENTEKEEISQPQKPSFDDIPFDKENNRHESNQVENNSDDFSSNRTDYERPSDDNAPQNNDRPSDDNAPQNNSRPSADDAPSVNGGWYDRGNNSQECYDGGGNESGNDREDNSSYRNDGGRGESDSDRGERDSYQSNGDGRDRWH